MFPSRPSLDAPVPRSVAKRLTVSGVIKDTRGNPRWDPNPDLTQYRLRGLRYDHGEYHRMYKYDGTVKGVNRLVQCEITRADWRFEHRPDETKDETTVRESCAAMLGLGDGRATFPGGLRGLIKTACFSTRYGFSPHEMCWDYVNLIEVSEPEIKDDPEPKPEDSPASDAHGEAPEKKPTPEKKAKVSTNQRLCPVEIRWVSPWSVDGWIVDETDTIKSMVQVQVITSTVRPTDPLARPPITSLRREKTVVVPIDKMLIFTHDSAPGNIEGDSMCRAGWWAYKAKLDTVLRDQNSLDKLADGLFQVEEQGDRDGAWRVVSATDQSEMGNALNAIRSGRSNKLWVPFGIKVVRSDPSNSASNHIEMLKYYDYMILVASLASVLGLGQTGATKGLSDGLTAILYHVIEDIADDVASVINGDGTPWTGLIEKYVRYNFPDFTGRLPRLVPGQIAFQDIASYIDAISKGQQFLSLTQDEGDENDLRRKLRMRRRSPSELRKARSEAAQRNGQAKQGQQARPSQAENGNDRQQSKKKDPDGGDNEAK